MEPSSSWLVPVVPLFAIIAVIIIFKLQGHLKTCPECGSRLTVSIKGWVFYPEESQYVEDRECRRCNKRSRIPIPQDQWPQPST